MVPKFAGSINLPGFLGDSHGLDKTGMKEYKAIVWFEHESQAKRVNVLAETLEEVRQKLVEDFGPQARMSISNEEDANRPPSFEVSHYRMLQCARG